MTERKGETKRQHYVPRMILRNFSKDAKRISLVVDGERIDGASLGKQCYGDYFYGADNKLEKAFAAEESKLAEFLGDLAPDRFRSLPAERVRQLLLFVAYQYGRTRGAAEHVSRVSGGLAKTLMRESLVLNGHPILGPKDLDLVDITLKNAQHEAIWLTSKSIPILMDLRVKFIWTDRTPGFVVADNPVVAYNQFAEHHPVFKQYPTNTGLAAKGLQLFLPLSPGLTLALFDPQTYQYGGNGAVCKAGPLDVSYLNQMQAVNALSCIYFHEDRVDDANLQSLVTIRKAHPSIYEHEILTSPTVRQEDGKMSQMVFVRRTGVRLGAKLSFIRTIDGHSYADYVGPSVPVRSANLIQLTKEFGEFLEAKVEEGRAKETVATVSGPVGPGD